MCKVETNQGPDPNTPDTPGETQGEQAPSKTKFQERLETAASAEEALALANELHQELVNTRKEAKNRRLSVREMEAELEAFKQKEEERKNAELSESERLKAENEALQSQLAKTAAEKAEAQALAAFSEANNPRDLLYIWNALPEEEKANTTAQEWAEDMKTKSAYLFKAKPPAPPAGGNPRGDGPGDPPPPVSTKQPTNRAEALETVQNFRKKYGS